MNHADQRLARLTGKLGEFFARLAGVAALTPYDRAIAGLPKEDFLTYQGRRVHVEEHGCGPPLLLLHGFAASTFSFHPLIPHLAGDFRVVALDYHGFGYTERPTAREDFDIAAQLDLIRHVMDAKRMGSAVVLGQSFGGTLALLLAQANPNRVKQLVLVGPATEFGAPPAWVRIPIARWAGYLACRWLLSSPKRFRSVQGRAYYRKEVLTEEVAEAYRQRLLIAGMREAYFAFTSGMASGKSPGLIVTGITTPALVVTGRHDALIPPEQAHRLVAALPSARLLILERSGHSAPEEEPEALAQAIREFAAAKRQVSAAPAEGG